MDPQETMQEGGAKESKPTYESRKERRDRERAQERQAAKRTQSMKTAKSIVIGVVVVAAVAGGIWALVRSKTPQGEDLSRVVPEMGREHIQVGAEHPPYNSNPPTSGWHYAVTARTGFRAEPIPDEYVIHNLEHGDIWISFHPRIPDAIKDQLKGFAATKVVITPREANEEDIALAAWGRVDTFNLENDALDEQRIRDFINRYINKGRERIPAGAMSPGAV